MSKTYDAEEFIFDKKEWNPKGRPFGISAIMRLKNAAEFLELAVESHIQFYDEIVAVYNDCTDTTPLILERLKAKYPNKIKVYEYLPEVYPPGSDKYKDLSQINPVNTLANYYNYAMSKTTYSVITKLDDDHYALPSQIKRITNYVREIQLNNKMLIFSGLNLMYNYLQNGDVGFCKSNLVVGTGDHFFVPLHKGLYFYSNPVFEVIKNVFPIEFSGFMYLHLKYLKRDMGFSNYKLDENKHSTYHNDLQDLMSDNNFISYTALKKDPKKLIQGPRAKALNILLKALSHQILKKELSKLSHQNYILLHNEIEKLLNENKEVYDFLQSITTSKKHI